jgi:ElaB/YqjD/DUF883 family membrane-anchored ribosome-binding protein
MASTSSMNPSTRPVTDYSEPVDARSALSAKVHDVRDQAGSLARRGLDAVKENAAYVKDRAIKAGDSTVGYIKDEPVKSILIAAAAGAALMALIGLLARSKDR